ncbi:MAG: DUF3347 domain-containing protein [Chitinophagales bacterium]|nr:DUF3347 domain-containing protein [Chitinophagaceae bacterium]MCB9065864.1 DUF3347 domain-containing protein [Chitinophagales bacterium]
MKSLIYVMLLMSAVMFVACNNGNDTHHDHNHDGHEHGMSNEDIPVVKAEMETDSMFQEHIDVIAHFYTHIQTALADDDTKEASIRAKQLLAHMHEYDTVTFSENEQEVYDKYEAKIVELSSAIQSAEDIDAQRKHFESMSDVMYQLVKTIGTTEPLYKSYCPMAFDGKGAMWLSETEEIANPYYGASMYSCGSVQEVVKR